MLRPNKKDNWHRIRFLIVLLEIGQEGCLVLNRLLVILLKTR